MAAAKTRNGDGPRYGRSARGSALDALRARAGDQPDRQADQADDEQDAAPIPPPPGTRRR